MVDKEVSQDTYFYAHMAVIVFHVLMGVLLILAGKKSKVLGFEQQKLVYYLGIILLIVSILALIPIIKYKDDEILIS